MLAVCYSSIPGTWYSLQSYQVIIMTLGCIIALSDGVLGSKLQIVLLVRAGSSKLNSRFFLRHECRLQYLLECRVLGIWYQVSY